MPRRASLATRRDPVAPPPTRWAEGTLAARAVAISGTPKLSSTLTCCTPPAKGCPRMPDRCTASAISMGADGAMPSTCSMACVTPLPPWGRRRSRRRHASRPR
eukprot:1027012-Prymnesium_polylepis.1